ncbi:hypothetical protein V1274_001715 [Bradyrhizobium sp. AZCC 1614]
MADPAAAARTDALEKSVATLRGELAAARAQGEKLASAINEVKSAPRGDGTVLPDLAAFAERITKVESQMRAQSAEIAQQGSKLADPTADAKPADDMPLRRVVSAALLDVLVRIGDPYPTALAAAKALAPNPEALKALDEFAEKGVPNAGKLSTELLALVPKLLPGPTERRHHRHRHRRPSAGRCCQTGQDRTHRYRRDGSRRRGGADHGGCAAQRFQRGAAGIEDAGAGRSRRGAIMA